VEIHQHQGDIGKGRIKQLYDRLASILRQLSPGRRAAFAEYLDAKQTPTKDDKGGPIAEGDAHEREDGECDSG
jgi:hypothetical protein